MARLPVYLLALVALNEAEVTVCSSKELAARAGVTSSQLRKDLSYLGSYGTRGVGYDVAHLRYQIARQIGIAEERPVVIAGVGNLGHALASYAGFGSRGFEVVALIDADVTRFTEPVGGLHVRPLGDLPDIVAEHGAVIGVIATPPTSAQEVADLMVAVGVRSILNFAPVIIEVPAGVEVRKVDLALEMQILAFHEQRSAEADIAPRRTASGARR